MGALKQFQQFLQEQNILVSVAFVRFSDDESIRSIHEVCKKLVATVPPLLSSNDVRNLSKLTRMAEDPIFHAKDSYGPRVGRRPEDFAEAISLLARGGTLNQETFNSILKITTANLQSDDIIFVAKCFIELQRFDLLTNNNIQALIKRVQNAPLRVMMAQAALARTVDGSTVAVSGPSIAEPSCAEQLIEWFHSLTELPQTDFDFMMNSRQPVAQVSAYRQALMKRNLYSIPNCQALLDSNFSDLYLLGYEINTQDQFNQYILRHCQAEITELNHLAVAKHFQKICSDPQQEFPGKLLHAIVLVKNVLSTPAYQPTQENVRELMAFANEAKGHPSVLWQAIGVQMALLGTAIAVALFPASLGLALGATAAALTGIGIFAYANKRTGLSKDCMDLAEAAQQEIEVPQMTH